mmetsp:Transcript_26245/g.38426  ORF Transcript_26245/g.38426 Transcript_26245/m.38426 type:complete len:230 (+) Transcript_26245:189-878(+)
MLSSFALRRGANSLLHSPSLSLSSSSCTMSFSMTQRRFPIVCKQMYTSLPNKTQQSRIGIPTIKTPSSLPYTNIQNQLVNASRRHFTSKGGSGGSGGGGDKKEKMTFLQRFLAPKEMPPRYTPKWYGEMVLLCTVFAITGSSTMVLVRPAVSEVLGLQGSMKDGPWSYRICSLVIMTPLYSALLVLVGTVFGRHAYFRHFSVKMFSRFGIPPELMDKTFHETAKNFRKY